MSYGEKITAQRPSIWMPSSCGSTWRTRAASGWPSSRGLRVAERDLADVEAAVGVGEERVVGRDALERVVGQRGGQLAAEGGGERLARADRVGQQRAAAFEVFAKLRRARRR